jgi:cell division transport system permease protein
MFLLSFGRILKFSFQDIFRNIWLSIVTITILVLALFSINMLIVVQVISQAAIGAVRDKIDVSVYLKPDSSEEQISALRTEVENLSEVKEVAYISRAEALEAFRVKNQDNPEIIQSLQEIGKNPLSPSLVIKPKDVEASEQFITDLNKLDNNIIESRNFTDHKLLLEKINAITKKVNEAGLVVSGIFVLITLLVVYNAVRVGIYTHRKEIAIMRLVGASNYFVYFPFLLSGIIFALVGVLIMIGVFYPFLSLLQPYIEAFFVDYNVNIIHYYNSNFILIFGWQFLGAALVSVIASYIAIRKYARV